MIFFVCLFLLISSLAFYQPARVLLHLAGLSVIFVDYRLFAWFGMNYEPSRWFCLHLKVNIATTTSNHLLKSVNAIFSNLYSSPLFVFVLYVQLPSSLGSNYFFFFFFGGIVHVQWVLIISYTTAKVSYHHFERYPTQ